MIKFGNQSVTAWMNGKPRSFQLKKREAEVEWLGFDNNCLFKLDYQLTGEPRFDFIFSLYDHTRPGVEGTLQYPLIIKKETPDWLTGQRCWIDYWYDLTYASDTIRLYGSVIGSSDRIGSVIYYRNDTDDSFITNKRLLFKCYPDIRTFSIYDTGQVLDENDEHVEYTDVMPICIGGQYDTYPTLIVTREFCGRFYGFVVYDDQDNIIRDYRPFRVDNVGVIKDIYNGNIIYPMSGACEVGPDK